VLHVCNRRKGHPPPHILDLFDRTEPREPTTPAYPATIGASPTGDARPEPDFLDSMISAHNAEALAKATTVRCPECKGRGWHPGDCHPREECGRCDGTGRCPPAPPAETTTTTDKEK
jgi:hypothetical protein